MCLTLPCNLSLFTVLPFTDTNNVKNKRFLQWIKARQAIEDMEEQRRNKNDTSPMHFVDCPLSSDVVFKSGDSYLCHPGNSSFKELLHSFLKAFCDAQANSTTKEVVTQIKSEVISRGGRFLEWSATLGCWAVIQDPSKLHIKIYHSIHQLQKSAEARKHTQISSSSTFMFERQDGKRRKRDSAVEQQCCARWP